MFELDFHRRLIKLFLDYSTFALLLSDPTLVDIKEHNKAPLMRRSFQINPTTLNPKMPPSRARSFTIDFFSFEMKT